MKFIRKIIVCLKYLFTKQDEYEYYNEDGELVIATGKHILDIIEDNNIIWSSKVILIISYITFSIIEYECIDKIR